MARTPSGCPVLERPPTRSRSGGPWPPISSTPAPTPLLERTMTRTRKSAGRIAFVGAGPGDPGLLTRRAYDALVSADQVLYDRGVPDALLADIRAQASPDAQFSLAEGASGDIAKVLLSAARSGLSAVHLV